jgi:hypothetical protein
MKKPQNFSKLDREFVECYGNTFVFEVIQKPAWEEIWIKEKPASGSPQQFGEYVLLLEVDFMHNSYSTRKCVRGLGYVGDGIDDGCTLPIHRCKTLDSFKGFLGEVITNEIRKHTFVN